MANSPLTDQERLTQAIDLFSLTTVVAVIYTLIFLLYCLSFRLFYAQLWLGQGKTSRQAVCTFVFQTVLLICATLDVVVKNCATQVLYIDNGGLLGGPRSPQLSAHSIVTLLRVEFVVIYIESSLIFGLLVWRVWVIWSGTRLVMLLMGVSLCFYLGVAGLALSYMVTQWSLEFPPGVQARLYIRNITLGAFSLAGYVFMTSAIIARLLLARRRHIKAMGNSDISGQYWGIAAMLIESYALVTLWGSGILISYIVEYPPIRSLFDNCNLQVNVFSNFLLIYRVISGRAWTRQTQDQLSTLRWAPNGATCGTVDIRQTSVVEEDRSTMNSCDEV